MKLKNLLAHLAFVLIGVGLISSLWNNSLLLTGILAVVWGVVIYYKRSETVYLICGALFGALSEIILIYFGIWTYANPTILGIPLWLPLVWGAALVVIKNIAKNLEGLYG